MQFQVERSPGRDGLNVLGTHDRSNPGPSGGPAHIVHDAGEEDLVYIDPVEGNISAQELIKMIQDLTPQYRMVFNLYALEGYSHKEISQMSERTGRKIIAAKGSQSTRQGFYSRILDEDEKLDFELASGVEGIDDEITLLRVEIKKAIEEIFKVKVDKVATINIKGKWKRSRFLPSWRK
jgi:hypothetical protein